MIACLVSGGKDSIQALHWAVFSGYDVEVLYVQPHEYSLMFHHPNVHMIAVQAELMNIKAIPVVPKGTEVEDEIRALKDALASYSGIVSGALRSEYQRRIIEQIGKELGIPTYAPLWHKNIYDKRFFSSYIVSVAAEGLTKEHLAKEYDPEELSKIPNIDPYLEGGEGETFVYNAPLFSKRIVVDKWNINWDGVRGIASIASYHLEDKI